jgi:hypothetical protein
MRLTSLEVEMGNDNRMDQEGDSQVSREPRASRPYMPGYGLLDASSGRGLLPWSWGVDRLSKVKNYYISTTRADGLPHCMPVWGVWLDDSFYFSSGRRSRKARNLENNPRCVVCPEGADQAVVMEGSVHVVEEGPVFRRFVEAYKVKYNFDMDTMDMSDSAVFAVQPIVAFGFMEDLASIATRWTFEIADL